MNLFLYAGLACLAIAGLLSGAFITTDYHQRDYFFTEPKDSRASREKVSIWFLLAGFVFLAVAGIVYLFR